MIANLTLAAINEALEKDQEKKHRKHLGASVIGKKCARQIWYGFHWCEMEHHGGKQLRLFKRGQDMENVFDIYLKSIGCDTWPLDPATGKQWRISDCNGHFGGSSDGKVQGIPEMPAEIMTVEMKTHGDKSYKQLIKEGLCKSKPEHFDQAQIYTYKLGHQWCLYIAINKNDDLLHLELIQVNPVYCKTLLLKAAKIIAAAEPPPKIKDDVSFYLCHESFCKFRQICHFGKLPEKNCRTCKHSTPVDGGKWLCVRYNYDLTKENQNTGCKTHEFKSCFLTE